MVGRRGHKCHLLDSAIPLMFGQCFGRESRLVSAIMVNALLFVFLESECAIWP
jgi:hypothetical protein